MGVSLVCCVFQSLPLPPPPREGGLRHSKGDLQPLLLSRFLSEIETDLRSWNGCYLSDETKREQIIPVPSGEVKDRAKRREERRKENDDVVARRLSRQSKRQKKLVKEKRGKRSFLFFANSRPFSVSPAPYAQARFPGADVLRSWNLLEEGPREEERREGRKKKIEG